MTAPLIHIGYPKAGSSWLQAHLFVDDAIGLVPVTRGAMEISRRLVYPHPLEFDAKVCRELFAEKLDEIVASGGVPVVTGERLSGAPHAGGYDSKEVAERIHDVFPEGRVLIVIREQKSMIRSAYKQYVRAGGALSLERYLQPSPKGFASFPSFDFGHWRYHRLIGLYHELFGASNVLVLPFEMLRGEPAGFARRIVSFGMGGMTGIGQPDENALAQLPYGRFENRALSATTIGIRRRLNRFLVRSRFNPTGHFPSSKPRHAMHRTVGKLERFIPASVQRRSDDKMLARIEELAGDQYESSNACTSTLTGLDLGAFGYDLP